MESWMMGIGRRLGLFCENVALKVRIAIHKGNSQSVTGPHSGLKDGRRKGLPFLSRLKGNLVKSALRNRQERERKGMKARFSDCPRQGKRRSGVLESEIGPKPPLSPPFPVGPSLAYQGDTVARSRNDEREAGERH